MLGVNSHRFCEFCAENTIPQYFGHSQICSSCSQFARIFGKISTCSYRNQICVIFLGAAIYDNACVGNYSILGNCPGFVMEYEKHGIWYFLICVSITLGHIPNYFSQSSSP